MIIRKEGEEREGGGGHSSLVIVSCGDVTSYRLQKHHGGWCKHHIKGCLTTNLLALELLLGAVHVEQGHDPGVEAPPGPALDLHVLHDVLLDAADGQVLHLENTPEQCDVSQRTGTCADRSALS